MNEIEIKGTFEGKQLYCYDPKINCTENDFRKFSSHFNRIETLRAICSISCRLFHGNAKPQFFGNVPLQEDILLDLTYGVIKYCDDKKQKGMNDQEIQLALKMCYKRFDSKFTKSHLNNSPEILTKIAYRQFVFQEASFNNFTRYYYILTELWYRLDCTKKIDILSEIKSEIGISYENALLYSYALVGNKEGHFWLYDQATIDKINDHTGFNLTVDSHKKFVKWCSGTYSEIIKHKKTLTPFVIHPVIATKTKPVKNKNDVFMIASPHHVHDKVTCGLYFLLAERFNKGGKNNNFKELFGAVFQEYVGELLNYYFKTWSVIPEIRYKKGKHQFQDSIDWFVMKDDKLIMIEVKQSSIYLKSKSDPSIERIKDDLRKTIIPGAKQLEVSEADIESKQYEELKRFNRVKNFVKLIVINDPLYNANSIVKSLMADEINDLSFQIININEFEILLSNQKDVESLFDLLYFKKLDKNEMDFKEFTISMFPDSRKTVEFLKPIWDSFFSKLK